MLEVELPMRLISKLELEKDKNSKNETSKGDTDFLKKILEKYKYSQPNDLTEWIYSTDPNEEWEDLDSYSKFFDIDKYKKIKSDLSFDEKEADEKESLFKIDYYNVLRIQEENDANVYYSLFTLPTLKSKIMIKYYFQDIYDYYALNIFFVTFYFKSEYIILISHPWKFITSINILIESVLKHFIQVYEVANKIVKSSTYDDNRLKKEFEQITKELNDEKKYEFGMTWTDTGNSPKFVFKQKETEFLEIDVLKEDATNPNPKYVLKSVRVNQNQGEKFDTNLMDYTFYAKSKFDYYPVIKLHVERLIKNSIPKMQESK